MDDACRLGTTLMRLFIGCHLCAFLMVHPSRTSLMEHLLCASLMVHLLSALVITMFLLSASLMVSERASYACVFLMVHLFVDVIVTSECIHLYFLCIVT